MRLSRKSSKEGIPEDTGCILQVRRQKLGRISIPRELWA